MRIVEYLGAVEEADRIVYETFFEPKDRLRSPDPNRHGLELDAAALI